MSFSDLCPVLAYLELLLGQQDTTVAVISPYDFCLDIIARLKYISQFLPGAPMVVSPLTSKFCSIQMMNFSQSSTGNFTMM